MQFLCKRRISVHSSTPLHEYPTIRLPREFKALIGKTASLYIDNDTDKLAFEVVIDKKVDKVCANLERTHTENRLIALESQISELKSLLFLNEGDNLHINKNVAHFNGPDAIRTHDLRRVKTEVFGALEAFSVGLLETTTRKASAPSCTV